MVSLSAASTSLFSEKCGFSSLASFIHQFTCFSNISFASSSSAFSSYLTSSIIFFFFPVFSVSAKAQKANAAFLVTLCPLCEEARTLYFLRKVILQLPIQAKNRGFVRVSALMLVQMPNLIQLLLLKITVEMLALYNFRAENQASS